MGETNFQQEWIQVKFDENFVDTIQFGIEFCFSGN